MANVEYLTCSFCQGPSSRLLRPRLEQSLRDPACRIGQTDLDWLDTWRLLIPAHVEWDLQRLRDVEFQNKYENELPKTNVISKIDWVPSIEGRISDTPESDDLDSWRTVEFQPIIKDRSASPETAPLEYPFSGSDVRGNILSKRALHQYNDDIEATRLPFHSACLRILYENCNEVAYSTYATSTVSDVVAAILLPSWRDGDVNMDWVPPARREILTKRLIAPWGEHWHPLDPKTNVDFSAYRLTIVPRSRPVKTQSIPTFAKLSYPTTYTKHIFTSFVAHACRSPRLDFRFPHGNNHHQSPSHRPSSLQKSPKFAKPPQHLSTNVPSLLPTNPFPLLSPP